MADDDELGQRIYAAVVSYMMGYQNVDKTLRECRKGQIDPSWTQLGIQLMHQIQDSRDAEREKIAKKQ